MQFRKVIELNCIFNNKISVIEKLFLNFSPDPDTGVKAMALTPDSRFAKYIYLHIYIVL